MPSNVWWCLMEVILNNLFCKDLNFHCMDKLAFEKMSGHALS